MESEQKQEMNVKTVNSGTENRQYSAAAVKQLFWFAEFRCILRYFLQGVSLADLRSMNKEQNIVAAKSPGRGDYIVSKTWERISRLPAPIVKQFGNCDVSSQKLIVLIAIMIADKLFFEFMNEIVRDKFILGDLRLYDKDFVLFFSAKQRESEQVAEWKDYTLKKIAAAYRVYLAESGIWDAEKNILKKTIPDAEPERLLKDFSMHCYLKPLTGGC